MPPKRPRVVEENPESPGKRRRVQNPEDEAAEVHQEALAFCGGALPLGPRVRRQAPPRFVPEDYVELMVGDVPDDEYDAIFESGDEGCEARSDDERMGPEDWIESTGSSSSDDGASYNPESDEETTDEESVQPLSEVSEEDSPWDEGGISEEPSSDDEPEGGISEEPSSDEEED